MALSIKRASEHAGPLQTAKRSWYVDADDKPTTDTTDAVKHIAEKGSAILPHIAAKYGFVDGDIPQKKSDYQDGENEAKGEQPSANKSQKPGKNK